MPRTYLFGLISASIFIASSGCSGSGDSSSSGAGAGGASTGTATGGSGHGGNGHGGGGQGGDGKGGHGQGGGGQGGHGQGGASSSSSTSSSSGSSSSSTSSSSSSSGQGGGGQGGGGQGGAGACNDGDTMACYSGPGGSVGVGVCKSGVMTCSGGAFGPCVGEIVPGAEVCNNIDDDCNGQTDELGTQTCGVGACKVTAAVCKNGMNQACVPLPPSAVEACEGTDDNCNGQVDEGCACLNGSTQACYTGPMGTQGMGVCTAGTQTCVNGAWAACVGDVTPTSEVCDAKDNNCNGSMDEGLGSIACGVGACAASVTACVGGVPQVCQPGMPSAEVCDGIDNNCNGGIDEGLGTLACGFGQCHKVVAACVNGQANACVPFPSAPEICDGIDNDCNNVVDNGNPGGGAACTTGLLGVCNAGTTTCTNGALLCTQNVASGAEVCDGLDNNCNGASDEGSPGSGVACNTGLLGVCMAGTSSCAGGVLSCNQNVASGAEKCDGLDNDCNGSVDNGNPGGNQNCSTGLQGVCGVGKTNCVGGAITCTQTNFAAAETCDGLDNNCNGAADEGNPGGGAACSTGKPGVCAAGTMKCVNGALSCVQNVAAAAMDICGNALDDNCNGQVDENVDLDGDGWGTCDGDCCDSPASCAGVPALANPALINPGAFEVLNNAINDDCDAASSDVVPQADCTPPALQTPTTATKLVQAMDICNTTTANPPLPTKKWGVISNTLGSADGIASAPQDIQMGVLANYGPNVLPKKGATMAALSSGTARDQGDAGWIQPNGGWQGTSSGSAPAAYLAAHGGTLQTTPSCSTSNIVDDSVNLKVQIRVPTNAKSFSYKFKFYSSEYPEWVCTQYNDFYLALLTSQIAGIPADKNISFDSFNNPVSVNNGFFDVCSGGGCTAGTAELIGTGMGGNGGILTDGGGTVWLTTTSPVKPGETMTIEFITFDTGDHQWDSLVLLDAFIWDLNSAAVGTNPS